MEYRPNNSWIFPKRGFLLSELPIEENIKSLRDLYLIDWPDNMIGYNTLDNFIRWQEIEPNFVEERIRVFVLIDRSQDVSNGTFLIVDHDQLFFNTLSEGNMNVLREAFLLFDWSSGYEVSSILDRHEEILMNFIQEKGLTLKWGNIKTEIGYFKKEKAADLELNCPNDIDIRPLSENDVMIADKIWPNRIFGSLSLLKRLVKLNPSVGAFKKDTGEVVAWCFQLQTGSIKVLQVQGKNMKKGSGSLVVRAMIKILALKNCDTFVCVREDKEALISTFKKCGFEFTNSCSWLRTKPTELVE